LAPHDESSRERQRERYHAEDELYRRYEKQQHEAAREPEPKEERGHQALLFAQVQGGKPHQQVKARERQNLTQIEHQNVPTWNGSKPISVKYAGKMMIANPSPNPRAARAV
jgi:hypothetical protein